MIFAGNAQVWCGAETDAEKDRGKIRLEVGEFNVDAQFFSEFQLHTELFDHRHFSDSDFNRFAKADDAVS